MAITPRVPTRDDLRRFLPDQRSIVAFEQLFKSVPENLQDVTELILEVSIAAEDAAARATEAVGQAEVALRRAKSNGVLVWLTTP